MKKGQHRREAPMEVRLDYKEGGIGDKSDDQVGRKEPNECEGTTKYPSKIIMMHSMKF